MDTHKKAVKLCKEGDDAYENRTLLVQSSIFNFYNRCCGKRRHLEFWGKQHHVEDCGRCFVWMKVRRQGFVLGKTLVSIIIPSNTCSSIGQSVANEV